MLTIIDDDGAVSSKTLSTELNLSKVVVQVLAQNLHLVSKDNPVLLGLLTALDCHKTNLCASPVRKSSLDHDSGEKNRGFNPFLSSVAYRQLRFCACS